MSKILSKKSKDLPATIGIVYEVRDELKADFRNLEAKIDGVDAKTKSFEARFDSIDARFDSIEARFGSIEARFDSIDARFDSIDARFVSIDARIDGLEAKIDIKFNEIKVIAEQSLASVHRVQAIVEEQRHENKIMLEALHGFVQRMDRIETKVDSHDEILNQLGTKSKF